MAMELVETDDGVLHVKGEATVHHADVFWQKLVEFSSGKTELTLDLSELQGLDSTGIQLLMALRNSIPELRIHSCPVHIRQVLEAVGLAGEVLCSR